MATEVNSNPLRFTMDLTIGQHFKRWTSACGHYRIVWRDEFEGVAVPPSYYAEVKCRRFDGREWWAFVDRRGPYKTRSRAEKDCNTHRRLWRKFIELSKAAGRKQQKLADLIAKRPLAFDNVPLWAESEVDPAIIRKFFAA